MNIDLTGVEALDGDSGSFPDITPGWYPVAIVDVKDREVNNGRAINVRFQITSDSFKNRNIFKLYAYEHTSEKWVNISKRGMKSIQEALGLDPNKLDTNQWLGQVLEIQIYPEKEKYNNETQYGIRAYRTDTTSGTMPSHYLDSHPNYAAPEPGVTHDGDPF